MSSDRAPHEIGLSSFVSEGRDERLATILEAATDFVGVADVQGRTLFVNRAGRRMAQFADDADVRGLPLTVFHPPEVGQLLMHTAVPATMRDGEWRGETAVLARDGTVVPVSQVVIAHRDGTTGEVHFLSTIARDIRETKRVERELREANERLAEAHALVSAIIEHAPAVAIQSYDAEGRITLWNPASERLYGYTAAEAIGRTNLDTILSPEDAVAWQELIRSTFATGEAPPLREWKVRTASGEIRHILSSAFPVLRADAPPRLICMDVDLTERRRTEEELRRALAERAELEKKLLQVQKLESIGRLAGGVAHDFNNVLTAILGYVTLAEYALPTDHAAARSLEGIKEVVGRGATLTRQLLAFARRQIVQPVVLDLHDLVGKLQHVLRRLLREDIELSLALLANEARVRIDPGQVEQVLMNLAVNARDAMPSGGRLVLETSNLDVDDELATEFADLAPGPYVLLRVIDSGSGMSADVRQHAFEPFFTTKPVGVGTGLGLATCYGIVKQAGGHVFLESEEGVGTTVAVLLPRANEAVDRVERGVRIETGIKGRGTLLVVEDDATVRSVMVEGLRLAGYEVLEAETPAAARVLYADRRGRIDAVVADVVLPGGSGPELVASLREHRPELPVAFVTGHTDHASTRDAVAGTHTAVLSKPFRNEELVRTLRSLLDASLPPVPGNEG